MMRLIGLLSLLLFPLVALAQDKVKLNLTVTVPHATPDGSAICISGNMPELGNWDPGAIKLTRGDGDHWTIMLEVPKGANLEFKFTRSNWETVEKDASGNEMENRKLTADHDTTMTLSVFRWRDEAEKQSTRTGDIHEHGNFESKVLGNKRSLWVWLPPGYNDDVNKKFPVIYMQDGQNLFDDKTAYAGEWKMDEAGQFLIENNVTQKFIIVGVSSTADRIAEYTPHPDPKEGGGKAADYAKFLLEEAKPFVDKTYRTLPDGPHTFVGGSSLGGLVSLYLVQTQPQNFGGAIVMSPSLWWNDHELIKTIEKDAKGFKGKKLWIDIGTKESDNESSAQVYVADVQRLQKALEKAGLKADKDFVELEAKDAPHNESAWSARIGDALKFIFPMTAK